jgi:alpha-L-fucosidase
LLNFPLPASGELDADGRKTLAGITDWMQVNSEGIFSSRPWKVHGEGPSLLVKAVGGMNEDKVPDLTGAEVRFTSKAGSVYAFVQGSPSASVRIAALGWVAHTRPGRSCPCEC